MNIVLYFIENLFIEIRENHIIYLQNIYEAVIKLKRFLMCVNFLLNLCKLILSN